MICCYDMVDGWKVFSLISSHGYCQRSSLLQIFHMLGAGFKPVQNMSSGFLEWSFAVVITITTQCQFEPSLTCFGSFRYIWAHLALLSWFSLIQAHLHLFWFIYAHLSSCQLIEVTSSCLPTFDLIKGDYSLFELILAHLSPYELI